MAMKKSTQKKTTSKPIPKKIIKKSTKKTIPKKIITKKSVKKVVNSNIEEADPPADINHKGWAKSRELEKAGIKQAKILRPKEDLWDKRKDLQKKQKRKSGVIILLDGIEKSGKTNFELTASKFQGFKGKRRDIPAGSPLYLLDTEFSAEDEADYHFYDEVEAGNIIVKNVFVEDPITAIINPVKSMEMLEEWAYSLKDETVGTLAIDTFTDYCNWAKWKLEEKKLGHDEEGEIKGKPDAKGKMKKRLSRYDFGWLYKRINTFLRNLRRMSINVILIAKVKDEWLNPDPSNPYAAYKTGNHLTDATKGYGYWVDIIARYEKIKNDDGSVTRILRVIDSRFETEDMKGRKYEIMGNPTFEGLIEMFKDLI